MLDKTIHTDDNFLNNIVFKIIIVLQEKTTGPLIMEI